MSVRLIWDTSALLAYVAGDTRAIALGELLACVEEAGDVTGIPALSLIASYRAVDADQQAKLLELTSADDGPTVILPVLAANVAPIAVLATGMPCDRAHAASAATEHDALLATYDRAGYAAVIDENDILDL
jgi:predicted nucleic acid-binding protein